MSGNCLENGPELFFRHFGHVAANGVSQGDYAALARMAGSKAVDKIVLGSHDERGARGFSGHASRVIDQVGCGIGAVADYDDSSRDSR